MGAPVGREVWQALINSLVVQRRRLAQYDELYRPMTFPNPGATEGQLRDAETRLGHALDPHYREFLTVADGWDDYFISDSLLGTADIGTGPRWQSARDTVRDFSDNGEESLAAQLGVAVDVCDWQPISINSDGYSGHLYLFAHDAPGSRIGSVYRLDVGADTIWPDLYSYLRDQLPGITEFVDSEALGPHSEPWGRDLRLDPPAIADIVAKIAELSNLAAPDRPTPLNPGATQEDLDALNAAFGGTLHPEHGELLAATDGMSSWGTNGILSTTDLLDGIRWNESLTRAQEFDDEQHQPYQPWIAMERAQGRVRERKAPIRERIGLIPAVPFAIDRFQFYGVDIRDGYVRELLTDTTITPHNEPRTTSPGSVREYLLTYCDGLWRAATR